jgi:hypothetical protein
MYRGTRTKGRWKVSATGSIIFLPVTPAFPFLVTDVPWPMPLDLQQKLVGGWVEPFVVLPGIVGWCNEDGIAFDLLPNVLATLTCERILLGNVFFTGGLGWDGREEWSPIPAELAAAMISEGGCTVTIDEVLEAVDGKAT